jgi:peptidoglycan/LPS O-acetylase OafA/YrhL
MSRLSIPAYLKSEYRPDIDGLRAIAVLSVVGYHAFPGLIHGGFVGVDIFFVISGYLISKHIFADLAAQSFSIRTFYARRVRRIFPALGVVLLACLGIGWVILSPGEYEQLGKHVEGGAGFVANLMFWKEAGYFDNAADTKPLLHLWSLGIEEQFYILWPLILAFLWRRPHHAPWALPAIVAASLAYSIFLVQHNAVADFYSPLSRFWELALGSALAYLGMSRQTLGDGLRNVLAWLGLGLIVVGVAALSSRDAFPGAWALLPALGAALLIQGGERAWLNRNVLSRSWLVWVGLISYPLYLWHWPLLSFARIMESATPAPILRAWLVAAAFVLAWLTYRLVEKPVRSGPRTRNIIVALCAGMFAMALAGETVRKLDGVKWRQLSMLNGDPATLVLGADRDRLQHDCGLQGEQKKPFQYCLSSAPRAQYAFLGDSKAEALFYGLVREAPPGMHWRMIGTVYPPVPGAAPSDVQQGKNELALQTLAGDPDVKVVALTMALRAIFPLDSDSGFIAGAAAPNALELYSRAIQRLEQSGKQVMFVVDNPTFPDPRSCISGGVTSSAFLNQFLRRKENPQCIVNYAEHVAGTKAYREFIGALKRLHPALVVYDPTPVLCDVPNNTCSVTRDGKFLYSYGDHISDYANSQVARDMLPLVQRLGK